MNSWFVIWWTELFEAILPIIEYKTKWEIMKLRVITEKKILYVHI